MRCPGQLTDHRVCQVDQLRLEMNGGDVPDAVPLHLDTLVVGDAPRCCMGLCQQLLQDICVKVSLVERDLAAAWNSRGYTRLNCHTADRGHSTGAARRLPDAEDDTGRSGQSIVSVIPCRRAGARRLSLKADTLTLRPKRTERGG